ncbi:MAG: DsbA family protein [Acidobacteriota bacterium]
MSVRRLLSPLISSRLLAPERLRAQRRKAEAKRVRSGRGHVVEAFVQLDDPYTYLLAQRLVEFVERFDVELLFHLVPPPDEASAPEAELLTSYSLVDARRLAARHGLQFDAVQEPSPDAVDDAQRYWLDVDESERLTATVLCGEFLWAGADLPSSPRSSTVETALTRGARHRDALGHYLGATCFYEGEWFWGIDRLPYLEERLEELGARNGSEVAVWVDEGGGQGEPEEAGARDLHWYLSFRSPYTWVAAERVVQLAERHGARLQLRYVLPMVMRGLPVNPKKGRYILLDTNREARRRGVAFGRICDPVGEPVERGYSLLPWAIDQGQGNSYVLSFLRQVWSEGTNAGNDRGLQRIVESAGLDWQEARAHLGSTDWKSVAEANRIELFDLGLWGVPSFRVDQVAVWGQDRLWVIEEELRR